MQFGRSGTDHGRFLFKEKGCNRCAFAIRSSAYAQAGGNENLPAALEGKFTDKNAVLGDFCRLGSSVCYFSNPEDFVVGRDCPKLFNLSLFHLVTSGERFYCL